MKEKILIFSDIHTRHRVVEGVLSSEDYDKAIFLGDYFDDFNDTPQQNHETAVWLKESLNNPKHIHLFGNHDVSYLYPGPATMCSGFTKDKLEAITSVLKGDADKFKFWHCQDGMLFTHAGLDINWIKNSYPKYVNETKETLVLEDVVKTLNDDLPRLIDMSKTQYKPYHPFYTCSFYRGGGTPYGGPLWTDFDEIRIPVTFPQICGHTPQINRHNYTERSPAVLYWHSELKNWKRVRYFQLSGNNYSMPLNNALYCLDTHSWHYYILDTESRKIEVKYIKPVKIDK